MGDSHAVPRVHPRCRLLTDQDIFMLLCQGVRALHNQQSDCLGLGSLFELTSAEHAPGTIPVRESRDISQ